MATEKERSIITDKVVVAKTGFTMEDWFRHLDSLGAQKMTSHEIFELIETVDGLAPLGQWNQGLLSTSYQWSRGLRERGEKAKGFEVAVSKTVNVPTTVLYNAFVDATSRKKWLDGQLKITRSSEDKSARAGWGDGGTRLSIEFYAKGRQGADRGSAPKAPEFEGGGRDERVLGRQAANAKETA